MNAFVAKHAPASRGVLSCFGRVLFRGYVSLMRGYAAAFRRAGELGDLPDPAFRATKARARAATVRLIRTTLAQDMTALMPPQT